MQGMTDSAPSVHPFLFSQLLIHISIPAGSTLDASAVLSQRCLKKHIYTSLESLINLTGMSLDCGRKSLQAQGEHPHRRPAAGLYLSEMTLPMTKTKISELLNLENNKKKKPDTNHILIQFQP